MSRSAQADILLELVELCRDLAQDVKQQLNYYRASVYKHESAGFIAKKIEQMRTIAALLDDEWMLEPFKDYEATVTDGNSRAIQGECAFSHRVTTLLASVDDQLASLTRKVPSIAAAAKNPTEFARIVRERRRELLAICRQGSRQWSFFHTL